MIIQTIQNNTTKVNCLKNNTTADYLDLDHQVRSVSLVEGLDVNKEEIQIGLYIYSKRHDVRIDKPTNFHFSTMLILNSVKRALRGTHL